MVLRPATSALLLAPALAQALRRGWAEALRLPLEAIFIAALTELRPGGGTLAMAQNDDCNTVGNARASEDALNLLAEGGGEGGAPLSASASASTSAPTGSRRSRRLDAPAAPGASSLTLDTLGVALPPYPPATASNFSVAVYLQAMAVCLPVPCSQASAVSSAAALAAAVRELEVEGGGEGSPLAPVLAELAAAQGLEATQVTAVVSSPVPVVVKRKLTTWEMLLMWWGALTLTPLQVGIIAGACALCVVGAGGFLYLRMRKRRWGLRVAPARDILAEGMEEGERLSKAEAEAEAEAEAAAEAAAAAAGRAEDAAGTPKSPPGAFVNPFFAKRKRSSASAGRTRSQDPLQVSTEEGAGSGVEAGEEWDAGAGRSSGGGGGRRVAPAPPLVAVVAEASEAEEEGEANAALAARARVRAVASKAKAQGSSKHKIKAAGMAVVGAPPGALVGGRAAAGGGGGGSSARRQLLQPLGPGRGLNLKPHEEREA